MAIESGYAVGDEGSTNNVDTLKNIWLDQDEAWEGIDEVLPTEAGAWEDPNEPDGSLSLSPPPLSLLYAWV
jgi:hypothetical protein